MPDYSGGNFGGSSYGAKLQNQIEHGTTNRQRNRDLLQKAALAAVQAGLVGAAGIYHKSQSDAKQQERKDIGITKRLQAEQEPQLAENALFRDRSPQLPDYKPMSPQPTTRDLAESALSDLKTTETGAQVPYLGNAAHDNAAMEAQVHGKDMNTAMGLMGSSRPATLGEQPTSTEVPYGLPEDNNYGMGNGLGKSRMR